MSIPQREIRIGRRYRTAMAEIRRVTTIEDGHVTYTSVAYFAGQTELAHFTHKRLPLEHFASEALHEMTPENRRA